MLKDLLIKLLLIIIVTAAVISAFAADDESIGMVIVYYFHGDIRCPTCHKLEQYSKEAIENNFKEALASGKLEYKVVNVEERGNEHYAGDYQLYTKSLILSLVKDGKEVKWKNLDKIWEYVGNKEAFLAYVKNGIEEYLKDAQ